MVRVWYKKGSKVLLLEAIGRSNLDMNQLVVFISQLKRDSETYRVHQAWPHGCHAKPWLGESASGLGIASTSSTLGAFLDLTLRDHDEFPSIEQLD